jgi:hypothetical protein
VSGLRGEIDGRGGSVKNHAFLEALNEYELREYGEQLFTTEDGEFGIPHSANYCYWDDMEIAPGIVARLCGVCGLAQHLPEESRQAQIDAGQMTFLQDDEKERA